MIMILQHRHTEILCFKYEVPKLTLIKLIKLNGRLLATKNIKFYNSIYKIQKYCLPDALLLNCKLDTPPQSFEMGWPYRLNKINI